MAHHPRLHLFTGKGGVGKTHAACLFAAALATAGRRALLAEIHGGGRVHERFGVAARDYTLQPVPALPGLALVNITPQAATREYALMILRFEALYRAIFENAVVKRFIRLVPSLGELTMLGKIWFHCQPENADAAPLDDIVIDLPATGHALSMLGAPSAVQATVPAGPMHDQGERLHTMLTDTARTRLYVVTRAEAMPITEAQEVAAGCRSLGVPLGPHIINHQQEPLPAAAHQAVASLGDAALTQRVPAALARYEARRREGERQLARLGPAALAAAVRLPHLTAWRPSPAALAAASAPLAPLAAAGPT